MSDIFLSYASQDRKTAMALAGVLERHGWTVWWDRRIPTGKDYAEVIETQLTAARCVIVLWSVASVASEWVKTEAADAKDRRLLVPVLIEPIRIPLEFRRIQAADLTGWGGEVTHAGLSTLVGDLTGILGAPPARDDAPKAAPTVAGEYVSSHVVGAAAADAGGGEGDGEGGGEGGGGAPEAPTTHDAPPEVSREPTERRAAEPANPQSGEQRSPPATRRRAARTTWRTGSRWRIGSSRRRGRLFRRLSGRGAAGPYTAPWRCHAS